MIVRILVRLAFGDFWKLRATVLKKKPSPRRTIYKRLYEEYLWAWGSDIPISSHFSGPPCFPHGPSSIFISGSAIIGKDCVIFQQVTIGSNSLEKSKRRGSPTLGDNVYVGAGAKIIGAVTLGDNILIGANAVVTRDIPSNSTVVEFNKIIPSNGVLDSRYITRLGERKVVFDGGRFIDFEPVSPEPTFPK